ncbi:polysaccharide ABC transporter ATP-binding protein [Rhodocytophaga aerolata]
MRGKEDPFAKIGDESQHQNGEFWALKDINFEVKQGEAVGIIGKNGAGKSTLLKILSRITNPTIGNVKIKGRIASLLEVGTGFNPDLTGRDNIFLNGAILGMTKREIAAKFDEIVDFSGIEKFIDTPVKRYSSGMYVRLAFAVAAHLESEILILDEVLAVGDTEFQKKCLGKMDDVAHKQGRTILFVSHSMQAVTTLTNTCIFLKNGQLKSQGFTQEVIKGYLQSDPSALEQLIYIDSPSNLEPKVTKVEIESSESSNSQAYGKPMTILFNISTPSPIKSAALSFQVMNSMDQPVTHLLVMDSEIPIARKSGLFELQCHIPKVRLYPGNYTLKVHFADRFSKQKYQTIERICPFEVGVYGEIRDYYWGTGNAMYVEDCDWSVVCMDQYSKV